MMPSTVVKRVTLVGPRALPHVLSEDGLVVVPCLRCGAGVWANPSVIAHYVGVACRYICLPCYQGAPTT